MGDQGTARLKSPSVAIDHDFLPPFRASARPDVFVTCELYYYLRAGFISCFALAVWN